ncbi:MAG: GtrA family protein [Flavobacteriaceae bacterium]
MNLQKTIRTVLLNNRQVILFIIIGFTCYLIGLGQLIVFVEWLKVEVNLANIITSIITIYICYLLNARFVFTPGRYSRRKEILTFYIFSSIGFVLNVVLLYILTEFLEVWYVIAKTLVTIAVAVFNFITRKRFVFLQ